MLRIFDKFEKTGHSGYTLAEMLIVLVIVSLVMLALPRATKKLYTVTTKAGDNGRMECYYDGSGRLTKVYATSSGQKITKHCAANYGSCSDTTNFVSKASLNTTADTDDISDWGCVFEPPRNPVYMALHAVGAGGSGAWPMVDRDDGTGKYYTVPGEGYTTKSSTLSPTVDDRWPTWLKDLRQRAYNKRITGDAQEKALWDMFSGFSVDDPKKNIVEIKSVWKTKELHYTKSGKAGRVVSMYFPVLPGNTSLYVFPGKGAEISALSNTYSSSTKTTFNGSPGENTVVFSHRADGTDIVLMNARGGDAGKVHDPVSGDTDAYLTPDPWEANAYDGDLKNEFGLQNKPSGFLALLADNPGKTESELAKLYNAGSTLIPPGDGGWGSYDLNNISDTDRFFYVNDYKEINEQTIGGGAVVIKQTGDKWSNVSHYAVVPSTATCTQKHTSYTFATSPKALTNFYGHCQSTASGDTYCTIGNSTDMEDKVCMGPTGALISDPRDRSHGSTKYFWNDSSNTGIKQDVECAAFTAKTSNKNVAYLLQHRYEPRCADKANDGNDDHCKVVPVLPYVNPYHAYVVNPRYYPYNMLPSAAYNVPSASGCYYDAQVGYIDMAAGEVVNSSPNAGSIVCKLSPEPLVSTSVDYLHCSGISEAGTYECPQGSDKTKNDICYPTNGGNGAVVLLW